MITDLIGELKSFDANEEQQKGIMGFFKKKTSQLDALKTKYDKTETNVEKIQSMLEAIRCSCSRTSPCWTRCTS